MATSCSNNFYNAYPYGDMSSMIKLIQKKKEKSQEEHSV